MARIKCRMDPTSRLARTALTLLLLPGAAACDRKPPQADPPAASASGAGLSPRPPATSPATTPALPASAPGSPLSRLVPAPRSGPRGLCPLAIEPGVSFGPVALGETLETLTKAGLAVKKTSEGFAELVLPASAGGGGTLKMALCEGKIIDLWIDDLRIGPDCVTYQGKPVARATPREQLAGLLGGCTATPPREGGAFESCAGGGAFLGHGMGNFLQIRVRPAGFAFDQTCEIATDDGSLVTLPPAARRRFLEQTLNLPALGAHWHVGTPGRDPLRIVKTPLLDPEKLTMFGSPVVWIEPAEARPGTAYFTITQLQATRTRGTLAFTYPIEGITGSVGFLKHGDSWEVEKSEIKER